jgi:hypothetical protein
MAPQSYWRNSKISLNTNFQNLTCLLVTNGVTQKNVLLFNQ